MARRKNMQRRRVILGNTFTLIRENGLDNVSLQMIADKSEISKSLLQSYYPHKSRLINDILHNLMSTIFHKLSSIEEDTNPYVKMKVFIYTLLELGLRDSGVSRVLDSMFKDISTLSKWEEILDNWLRDEGLHGKLGDDQQVRIGLTFVVAGSANLYAKRGDLGIIPEQIADIMVRTFLVAFLNEKPEKIEQMSHEGHELIKTLDIVSVHAAINGMFEPGKDIFC